MKKAVTMSDIAKRLGVSTVSVSKALSGQKGVSEPVREQIIALAREMGYRSIHATSEAEKETSYRIGVLVPSSALATFDSFYWRLYQAVSEKAIARNCFSGYENLTEDMTEQKILPRLVLDKMVDGLIVIGKPGKGYEEFLKERAGMPLVFLDFYDTSSEVDCIVSDSFYGTYLLTSHLLEMGHRDIAFVGTLFSTESITDRYLGFQKAMMERGLRVPEDHVIPDRETQDATDKSFRTFTFPKKMPTAFVCNCDVTAGTLIRNLKEIGYKVPQDVSVTGFDDYPNEKDLGAAITTYAVDLQAMAKEAVKSLIRQMSGESFQKGIHVVEGSIVYRESVKSLK
ncbi:MAG: substrate-binding domain-containing protein [Lachnospiraceae bacterium]|nr:substrate-binding domain-containing protein [Lachnospiraceae bacterium]